MAYNSLDYYYDNMTILYQSYKSGLIRILFLDNIHFKRNDDPPLAKTSHQCDKILAGMGWKYHLPMVFRTIG